jgi:hypothetical protein
LTMQAEHDLVHSKAAEAWAMVCYQPTILNSITGRKPMEPGIAIDYVQDVCGDRDDAVSALLNAAADWLETRLPDAADVNWMEGGWCCNEIRGECFSHAEMWLQHVCERVGAVKRGWLLSSGSVTHRSFDAAQMWYRWHKIATNALRLCREITAAAYPEAV